MKNKILGFVSGSVAFALPFLASAAQYSTTTAQTDLNNAYSDIGILIGVGVGAALTGLVALTGVGFGWRHFKKYVSGRKF